MSVDRKLTKRIINQIDGHRWQQIGMGHSPYKDDTLVDSELLSAAMSYIDLAQQQIRSRDMTKLKPTKLTSPFVTSPFVTSPSIKRVNQYIQIGGTDLGYNIGPNHANPPSQWPFDATAWAPHYPSYNLIRAGALIVAELERLERKDKEIFEEKKPKKRAHIFHYDNLWGESTAGALAGPSYNLTSSIRAPSYTNSSGASIDTAASSQFLKSGTF